MFVWMGKPLTQLVKPQCLHTGHPKQFSSQWEVSWNNNTPLMPKVFWSQYPRETSFRLPVTPKIHQQSAILTHSQGQKGIKRLKWHRKETTVPPALLTTTSSEMLQVTLSLHPDLARWLTQHSGRYYSAAKSEMKLNSSKKRIKTVLTGNFFAVSQGLS